MGVFASASTAGFAIGSPFGNFCYDFFGDYQMAFLIFGVLMVFVTISMQFVLSSAHRDKKIILENEQNTISK